MPAQDRVRGDQAAATQCSGQPLDERGEHGSVCPVHARSWVGAAQDGDFVPQHSRLQDPRAWQHGDSRPEFIGELADTLQALPAPIRLILDDVH